MIFPLYPVIFRYIRIKPPTILIVDKNPTAEVLALAPARFSLTEVLAFRPGGRWRPDGV